MMTDLSDITKIRQKLSVCIDPINDKDGEFTKTIVETLLLVSSQQKLKQLTYVYDCLQISNAQYADFNASLP